MNRRDRGDPVKPVYIRNCIPEPAEGNKKAEIIANVKKYSKAYGTDFVEREAGLGVWLAVAEN